MALSAYRQVGRAAKDTAVFLGCCCHPKVDRPCLGSRAPNLRDLCTSQQQPFLYAKENARTEERWRVKRILRVPKTLFPRDGGRQKLLLPMTVAPLLIVYAF